MGLRSARDTLRGVLWAVRAVRSVRRQLAGTGYVGLTLPLLPPRSPGAARGVDVVLRRLPATCLERAMIVQRWRAADGDPRDVVIGIRGAGTDVRAHAWIDGEAPSVPELDYRELLRIRP